MLKIAVYIQFASLSRGVPPVATLIPRVLDGSIQGAEVAVVSHNVRALVVRHGPVDEAAGVVGGESGEAAPCRRGHRRLHVRPHPPLRRRAPRRKARRRKSDETADSE